MRSEPHLITNPHASEKQPECDCTKDNAVVLNDGLDFKESSSTSDELQLNENKRTNAAELCKLFCMPADVLNGKANESMISQFVQNCLMPLINTIESALDRDLLAEAEKIGHYYWAFDSSELTRGDFASRMNAYAVALQNNIYHLDEIREMEDKPPLGFNFIKLGLDAVLVDTKTMDIYTPNTGKLEKMNAEHLTEDELRAILEARGKRRYKQNPTTGLMEGSYPANGVRMSKWEVDLVSSGLKTNHPNLKTGEIFPYEYGDHFYLVDSLDSGGYRFLKKISLTPKNQARINRIRKEYSHDE